MTTYIPPDVFYAKDEIVKIKRGRWQGDLGIIQKPRCGKNLSTYLVKLIRNGIQEFMSFTDIEPWYQVGRMFESDRGDLFIVDQIKIVGEDKQVWCRNALAGYPRLFWQDGKADKGSESLILYITTVAKV